jgi:hypothetical protein
MISEIPKLFDKNFAIAYFLPAAAFVIITQCLFAQLDQVTPLLSFSKYSLLQDISAFGLVSIVVAVILSIINRYAVRFLEGYWSFTLFHHSFDLKKYFNKVEVWRYDRLNAKRKQLDDRKDSYSDEEYQNRLSKIEDIKANCFPDNKDLILPTSFGNIYRAFETYTKTMYGIDAIPGWYRLFAVIPKDFRDPMNDARTQVDLGVNFWLLSVSIFFEYFAIVIRNGKIFTGDIFKWENLFWVPPLAIVCSYLSYSFAKNAVGLWGNWVKAAFDLYLPKLRDALEFEIPKTSKEERQMWEYFNIAVIYKLSDYIPKKKRPEKKLRSKRRVS